jgi:proteasome lid subunit RPN8/RPN11
MPIEVTSRALGAIQSHSAERNPEECCGLLLGEPGRIESAAPARNIAADSRHRFEIDPQALIDAERAARGGGPQVIGYYHSHPGGLSQPSKADRAEAAHDGLVWAIAGEDGVTFWRDDEHGFTPLSYSVADR